MNRELHVFADRLETEAVKSAIKLATDKALAGTTDSTTLPGATRIGRPQFQTPNLGRMQETATTEGRLQTTSAPTLPGRSSSGSGSVARRTAPDMTKTVRPTTSTRAPTATNPNPGPNRPARLSMGPPRNS